jgi:phosphoribosyl-AMP cyclohydrolase / phosphoribosyl-ATP pyrophosphohydrolase
VTLLHRAHTVWLDELKFDDRGLVPVVTQDAESGEVLMVAYANRAALEACQQTGSAHYWSRSRNELWRKGATSGNVQDVVEIRVDCDGDAVLYRVHQSGPACHTGSGSCFHRTVGEHDLLDAGSAGHILSRLARIIEERERDRPEGSYTTFLFDHGLDKILKKVGEEATETVIAAKNDDPRELTMESADLIFHLLVMLRAREVSVAEVWRELERRFGAPPRPGYASTKR